MKFTEMKENLLIISNIFKNKDMYNEKFIEKAKVAKNIINSILRYNKCTDKQKRYLDNFFTEYSMYNFNEKLNELYKNEKNEELLEYEEFEC